MASSIADFRPKVSGRIKDNAAKLSVTPGGDIDNAITSAREEYEKTRPREKAAKVPGTGGFDYPLTGASPVLAGFVDGSSLVLRVAYPFNSTDQKLSKLEDDEFGQVRLDTGLFLRFWTAKPQASEFFLAVYTTPHTVDATTSTVPASDDEALSDLAACYACEALAALYNQVQDTSIQADSVEKRTKSQGYRSMADTYRKAYKEKMDAGVSEGPASALTEIDRSFGNRFSEDYFFHGRVRF